MHDDDRRDLLKNISGYRWSCSDIFREFKVHPNMNKFTNIVIMPLHRLLIKKQTNLGRFRLFPPNSVNITEILSTTHFLEKEKWIKIYEQSTLVMFLITEEVKYPLGADENNQYLTKCIEEAHTLLDLIKYYYCGYDKPEMHPAPPGLIEGGTSTMINMIPALYVNRFYREKILTYTNQAGRGLKVDDLSFLQKYLGIFEEVNEVGQILKQALRLNRIILDLNDFTAKFVQIMSLLDFLAFPETYKNFSEAKEKVIIHIINSNDEFERLKNRFNELTGKKEYDEAGKIKYIGIRTRIVHLGETLDRILPSKYEINCLFQELQKYSYAVLNDMFRYIYSTWDEFEQFRFVKKDAILKNKIIQKEIILSNTVLLVDIDYLNIAIPRIISFYKSLNSKKELSNLNFLQLLGDLVKNGRAAAPGKIIPIICFCSSFDKILFCDEGELRKWDKQLLELDNTYFQIIVYHAKNVPEALTNEIGRFFGNQINSIERQCIKLVICADESKVYEDYFENFNNENQDIMLIRNSNYTTSFSKKISLPWVKIDYVIAYSLGLSREEL